MPENTAAQPAAPAGADPIQQDVTLAQTVGGVTFELNPKTTASQVKTRDGLDVETRMGTLERAISGKSSLRLVDTIEGRDALLGTGLIPGDQVWVIDATGDPTVKKGGAKYLYMTDNSWLKTAELESLDLVQKWELLEGAPESTPAQIDLAVAQRHSHDNINVIAHLADDGAGNLLYNGQRINDGKVWVARADSPENAPANLADGGLLIIHQAAGADAPDAAEDSGAVQP